MACSTKEHGERLFPVPSWDSPTAAVDVARLQAVALHWGSCLLVALRAQCGCPIYSQKCKICSLCPSRWVWVSCHCSADAGMLQVGQGLLFVLFSHALRLVPKSQCPCHVCSLYLKGLLTGKEAVSSSFPLLTLMVSGIFPDCPLSNINTPLE